MSNLVIVALPAEDDYVWKISSEKKPHLTLLFLGEAESNPNVQSIMEFVQHAVTVSEHGDFWLDVDRRDVIGEDRADVLRFRKDWSFRWINFFRSQLLQNSQIKLAHDSAEQFSEWDPHLTLGYPETPAKPDERDFPGIRVISFDRIAVWTGNYEGPEFRLKWPERNLEEEVGAWSATSKRGEEFLTTLSHISEQAWSAFTKADYTVEQWHTACLIHQHDGAPTSKNECKLPVKTPDGALNRNGVHAAAAALSGARGGVDATDDQKKKAAAALRGFYKQLDEEPPESLAQSALDQPSEEAMSHITERGAEFVAHYGVKGMHWGTRKAGAVTTKTHIDTGLLRRQTKIEVKGGEAHDAHDDAIKAAIQKQKLKKSGSDALSNQELRDLANRLQLENQVAVLASSKGKQFVSEQLTSKQTKQEIRRGVTKGATSAAPNVFKKARRAAATGATVTALM